MAYYEKASSRDIARFTIALVLLFVAVGSFGYLISRFGVNPMALRNSVTWDDILNPNAEVKLNAPSQIAEKGQVAGEKDTVYVEPLYQVQRIDSNQVVSGQNTVELVRIENIPLLRYNGTIIAPQNGFDINNLQLTEIDRYPWKPLFRAPGEVTNANGVFSYYASSDTANLVIVMQWGATNGSANNRYGVYVYNEFDKGNPLRLVHTFEENSSTPSIPKAAGISADGRFIAINLFQCATCSSEVPETVMIDSKDGYGQNIGKTSVISWGSGGEFQYKEYKEVDCPDTTQQGKCVLDPQYVEFKSGKILP